MQIYQLIDAVGRANIAEHLRASGVKSASQKVTNWWRRDGIPAKYLYHISNMLPLRPNPDDDEITVETLIKSASLPSITVEHHTRRQEEDQS